MNPVGSPLLSVIISGVHVVEPFSPLRPCHSQQTLGFKNTGFDYVTFCSYFREVQTTDVKVAYVETRRSVPVQCNFGALLESCFGGWMNMFGVGVICGHLGA